MADNLYAFWPVAEPFAVTFKNLNRLKQSKGHQAVALATQIHETKSPVGSVILDSGKPYLGPSAVSLASAVSLKVPTLCLDVSNASSVGLLGH